MRFKLIPLLFVTGCAFGPGEPFATIEPRFEARYEIPADRTLPEEGWAKLASDYEIRVTAFSFDVNEIELRSRSGGGAGRRHVRSREPAAAVLAVPRRPLPSRRRRAGVLRGHPGRARRWRGGDRAHRTGAARGPHAGPPRRGIAGAGVRARLHAGPDGDLLGTRGPGGDPDRGGGPGSSRAEAIARASCRSCFRPGPATLEADADIVADRTSPPRIALEIRATPGPRAFDARRLGQPGPERRRHRPRPRGERGRPTRGARCI